MIDCQLQVRKWRDPSYDIPVCKHVIRELIVKLEEEEAAEIERLRLLEEEESEDEIDEDDDNSEKEESDDEESEATTADNEEESGEEEEVETEEETEVGDEDEDEDEEDEDEGDEGEAPHFGRSNSSNCTGSFDVLSPPKRLVLSWSTKICHYGTFEHLGEKHIRYCNVCEKIVGWKAE